jgi:hypothetical protein
MQFERAEVHSAIGAFDDEGFPVISRIAATVHTRCRRRDHSATLQASIHALKSPHSATGFAFPSIASPQTFVGRGMDSADAVASSLGSVGWFDCRSLIGSSILYGRRCSIKGRIWEGNRRKYAEFEVYRP